MAELAIRAENLSKRYAIGRRRGYSTLKDALRRLGRSPAGAREGAPGGAPPPSGTVWAFRDVTFSVERGEVVGIIGRNGSGKSTLLKVLSRVTPPTTGFAEVHGRVGSLLEVGTGFHPELTGRENVVLNAAVLGMSRREVAERFDEILDFAEITGFEDTPVKHYSSGMQMRLAFAVAAHLDPEILFVDEVLAVGDLAFQKKCLGKLDEVTRGGRTVLFVSHDLAAISQLCSTCIVLEAGRATFRGGTAEAIQRYAGMAQPSPARGRRPLSEVPHERRVQIDPRVSIEEIGLAADQSDETAVGASVGVEILLDVQAPLDGLSFGYSVHDAVGGTVLSGWSMPVDFRRGKHVIDLRIEELPLAPGSYDLSISAVTGSLKSPKYTYDMVLRFGRFTVVPFTSDGAPVAEWSRSWGRVVHTQSQVRVQS